MRCELVDASGAGVFMRVEDDGPGMNLLVRTNASESLTAVDISHCLPVRIFAQTLCLRWGLWRVNNMKRATDWWPGRDAHLLSNAAQF